MFQYSLGHWKHIAHDPDSKLQSPGLAFSVFRFPLYIIRKQNHPSRSSSDFVLAGGQGIEPRFLGPKPSVLPLDDPPIYKFSCSNLPQNSRTLYPTSSLRMCLVSSLHKRCEQWMWVKRARLQFGVELYSQEERVVAGRQLGDLHQFSVWRYT